MNKKPKVIASIPRSYLAVISNSRGSRMFRNYIATVDGVTCDITEDGDKSCAFYVSSILAMFGLLRESEVTVHRTIDAMRHSGWTEIRKPRVGCVIVWKEVQNGRGILRKHMGFYIGNDKAISNSSIRGVPVRHAYKTYKGRGILTMFWHKKLEQ